MIPTTYTRALLTAVLVGLTDPDPAVSELAEDVVAHLAFTMGTGEPPPHWQTLAELAEA